MSAVDRGDQHKGLTLRTQARFRILDAMFLMAGLAIGCLITKKLQIITNGSVSIFKFIELWKSCRYKDHQRLIKIDFYVFIPLAFLLAIRIVMPILAMLSVAMIPVHLIQPRSGRERIGHRPGIVALYTPAIIIIFLGLQLVIALFFMKPITILELLGVELSIPIITIHIGSIIFVQWIYLFIDKKWLPEPNWIDKLGLIMGSVWVLATPPLLAFLLYEATFIS